MRERRALAGEPVGASDPDYFALRLLAEVLGGGMASRLFQEAREARGLAYAIDAYSETYSDVGVLGVFAGSALWWLLLSGGIGLLRLRLTPGALRWINRVSGAILVVFGALALASIAG